jgi:hypothetical protein
MLILLVELPRIIFKVLNFEFIIFNSISYTSFFLRPSELNDISNLSNILLILLLEKYGVALYSVVYGDCIMKNYLTSTLLLLLPNLRNGLLCLLKIRINFWK